MAELPSFPWWRKDATLIAVLTFLAVVALAITFFFTRSYRIRQHALARSWFRQGEASLSNGHPREAVGEFRAALGYSDDDPVYRLRLAQALAADPTQTDQAIAYFLNLWEQKPGDGLYNLELARLYARKQQNKIAAQYYSAAISGAWADDPATKRRGARLEYIQFLLAHDSRTLAQAEAITLAAGVQASDIPSRFLAADTLADVGEYERALAGYLSLIENDRQRAAAGAGKVAFISGRFLTASKYLDIAIDAGDKDQQVGTRLEQANQIIDADPRERGIGSAERARRVSEAYKTAGDRLQRCSVAINQPLEGSPPTTELQQLNEQWKQAGRTLSRSVRESDTRDQLMDLVFRIESTTSRLCGTPSGPDWALLMLGRYGDRVQQ